MYYNNNNIVTTYELTLSCNTSAAKTTCFDFIHQRRFPQERYNPFNPYRYLTGME